MLMKIEIFVKFFFNTQVPNFMKIRPAKAELFHADTTKLMVALAIL